MRRFASFTMDYFQGCRSDTAFELRAERAGRGDGRVYTIIYQAEDASGNAATVPVTVTVPHSQGRS